MGSVQLLVISSVADVQRLSYTLCLGRRAVAFCTTITNKCIYEIIYMDKIQVPKWILQLKIEKKDSDLG